LSRRDELAVLLRSARQLAKLCRDGAALVAEARDADAPRVVMAATRQMHSNLQRTKHAAEDVLVAYVLDCSRCCRPGPLGARRGMRARALGARGASTEGSWPTARTGWEVRWRNVS